MSRCLGVSFQQAENSYALILYLFTHIDQKITSSNNNRYKQEYKCLRIFSGLSRSGQVGENTLKVWFWYDPQQVSNPCLLFGRPPPLSLQLPLGGRMIPFNGKRNMVLDHRESFYLSERNCREVTSSFQLQKFSMWITWWSSFFFLFYCCSFFFLNGTVTEIFFFVVYQQGGFIWA